MSNILITAGNLSESTFEAVCYAAKTVFKEIEAIHIFDTQESAIHAERSQRNAKIRSILGDIDINTSLVNYENLQIVIPDRISRAIRSYGTDGIIVDLSNGQKITSSVLYAVSTISRINNIYTLEFRTKITKETKISDLNYGEDWDYVRILPLKEILNITQSSYVELVYYRDRIAEITIKIEQRNRSLASDVRDRLEHSLIDYFTLSTSGSSPERLERCVNGLGEICEDIAELWHSYCAAHNIISTTANNFNSRIKQIMKLWEEYRAPTFKVEDLPSHISTVFVQTLTVDSQMDVMRIYRNIASHSKRKYQYTKHDARLALDMTLLILERIGSTDIIQAKSGES
ncbi:MAG: hypothetical protein OHK0022_17800 [Roseiflexaceae bacterium]